jgi:anti-sigma factor RsiW
MKREECRHLLNCLSEYVDGTLEELLCAELEQHMEGCEDCRVVVDTLSKTITLYRQNASQASCPEDVRQRLFHRLNLDEFMENSHHSI